MAHATAASSFGGAGREASRGQHGNDDDNDDDADEVSKVMV